MKITTPAALLGAGVLFSGALVAQEAGKEQAATPPKAAPKEIDPPTPPGVKPPAKPPMDPAEIKTYTSYGFGFRNGRNFTSQTGRYGLQMEDVDREQFLKGLFDALEMKDSALDQDKINEALNQLSSLIKEREKEIAKTNLSAGEQFLAENKKREGVVTTESGLQYEIVKEGDGEIYKAPPTGQRPTKQFLTIYRGTLIDGTEFDSSKGKVTPMSLNVIPGFREALTQMPVGSKWKLFIPADLAYKESRRSALLGPNSTLIFELELTGLKDLPAPPARPALPRPGAGGPGVRPGARAVSPPVRVPSQPGTTPASGKPRARAVSPPVRIPTNPKPAPKPAPAPAPKP